MSEWMVRSVRWLERTVAVASVWSLKTDGGRTTSLAVWPRALYPPATRYPNGGWVPCFVGWMGR